MLILGFGLGMVMQVLVLAVQNAVPYEQLGVATSESTLFRQIGGSIGVSMFGAIFANRLGAELADRLPGGFRIPTQANPAVIHDLPAAVRERYLESLRSDRELERIVSSIVRGDARDRIYERVIRSSGVELSPA
jgi:hypothetical protein